MSEFEENETISDHEKLQIANHFLMSSPPGQFNDVLNDVKKLVSTSVLTEDIIANTSKAFNLKTLRVVSTPQNEKSVLNPASEIDGSSFCSNSGDVYSVEHQTLATRASDATAPSNQNSQYCSALQQALSTYVSGKFQPELSAGTAVCQGDKIMVYICAEKPNLRNFWSGKWTSTWTVSSINGNSCSVSGDIKIHCHYFEDGNVQLVNNKSVPAATVKFASEGEFGTSVVKYIKNAESNLQTLLEDMYANMNEETFKSMRRIMPITRTKMDWNLNSVRMVRQVRK